MRPFILFALTFIAFTGCSNRPVITDNSTVAVQPGLGITNLCAVGMTYRAVHRATVAAGVVKAEPWTWSRLIPWQQAPRVMSLPFLGGSAHFDDDGRVTGMWFDTATNRSHQSVFRGKLGATLSFKDGPVSKAQVESVFGIITQTNPVGLRFTRDAGSTEGELGRSFGLSMPTNPAASTLTRGLEPPEPRVIINQGSLLIVNYAAQGILFLFERNRVTFFNIEKPERAKK